MHKSRERGLPSMLVRETFAHPSRFSRVLPLQLGRAPLLYAAVVFALGVAAGQWWWRPASLLVLATGSAVVLAAIALRSAPRLAALTTLLTWFVLGWTVAILHPRSTADRSLLPYEDGMRREAIATVLAVQPMAQQQTQDGDPFRFSEQATDQESGTPQQVRYTADLSLSEIEQLDPDVAAMVPATGTARVTLDEPDGAGLRCGETLRVLLRLYRPREFRDPGVWQYGSWLAEQQVLATGTAIAGRLTPMWTKPAPLLCSVQQVRTWASTRLRRFAQWQQAQRWPPAVLRWRKADVAAWNAMLFGDRSALTHNLRASFERTGTFHLFVVSGMHIGLFAWVVFAMAERMRFLRWLASLLTAVMVSAYAVLTGFGEPVQRALGMTLIFLLAEAFGRERNALNAIGAATLFMLLVRPISLRDTSFQMTVLIAVTIAGIAIPLLDRTIAPYARACRSLPLLRLDRRLPPRVAQFRVLLRWLASELDATFKMRIGRLLVLFIRAALALLSVTVLSLVIELIMALPMAVSFHRFTTLALPSNLVLVPLILPMMALGVLTFLLSLISFPVALLAAVPASLLLHLAASLVSALAAVPGADLRTPGPTILWALALLACIGMCVVLIHLPQRRAGWAGVLLAFAVAAGTVLFAYRIAAPHALQITAIDVGQGDSILIVAPDGKALLMDAGGVVGSEQDIRQQQRSAGFDIGEQVVSPYLWYRGISRLDVLALSHAHMDHLGGMASVLRNFRPRELWLSEDVPSDRLHSLLTEARAQGTTIHWFHAGDRVNWHGLRMDVLSPRLDYQPGNEPANDDSLVLHAAYGQASALLAGDAELPSEQAMLATHLLTPVTLLKVGHHGSMTSSSEPFLDALSPQVAVISCGRGNHFGHPRMPVLQRLGERHVLTSRTDTMGAVEYTLHQDGTITSQVSAATE